jgi:putative DNA primase/helicase
MTDEDNDDRKIVLLRPEAWMVPDWLPTGEALVKEWMKAHGKNFCFIDAEGQWYHFVEGCWRIDEVRRVNALSAELCSRIGDSKKRSIRMKLEAPRTINGVATRVKDECAQRADAFDHHPAINTPTGEWSGAQEKAGHTREHLHSKITAASPALGEPIIWLRFLKKIMAGNQALIDYLQRLAGYCCSTSNKEQVLVCFYGSGQNGKSVFIKTLTGILGTYASQASIETFLASKFDRHPEELASFRGVRLVVASEPDQSRSWNESMIKQITGGEKIRARFMRQNSFEYTPLFKLLVSANHKPSLRSTDKAIRRRFHIVPFEVQIADEEIDKDLADKLIAEWPQIFTWMLAGLDAWKATGLAPPDEVLAATTEYMEAQDIRGDWLEECCDRIGTAVTATAELFANWKVYAEARGEYVGTVRLFSEDLIGRGFYSHRTEHARGFKGIAIKPDMRLVHNFGYRE